MAAEPLQYRASGVSPCLVFSILDLASVETYVNPVKNGLGPCSQVIPDSFSSVRADLIQPYLKLKRSPPLIQQLRENAYRADGALMTFYPSRDSTPCIPIVIDIDSLPVFDDRITPPDDWDVSGVMVRAAGYSLDFGGPPQLVSKTPNFLPCDGGGGGGSERPDEGLLYPRKV